MRYFCNDSSVAPVNKVGTLYHDKLHVNVKYTLPRRTLNIISGVFLRSWCSKMASIVAFVDENVPSI